MTTPRVALIGAGFWGRNLARNLQAQGVLAWIIDPDPAVPSRLGPACPGVAFGTDPAQALGDASVTAVAIAAPAARHQELAEACLSAGKDLFVEKPLCLDVSGGRRLVEQARVQGRILMVGHLLRYHPAAIRLLELCGAGELGRLRYITSNRLNLGRIRTEENALWSFAPHDFSVILALAGDRLPDAVRCTGESHLSSGVADTTLTALRFASGLRAHVHVSWLNPFKEQRLTVVGDSALAVFDDTRPWSEKLVLYRKPVDFDPDRGPTANKPAPEPVPLVETEPLAAEVAHFLEACRRRVPPRTDGQEGLRVLAVLAAAQRSLEGDGELARPLEGAPASTKGFIHPSACVDEGAVLAPGCKIWHFCHVMPGAVLGEGCSLGQNVFVAAGVRLGRNCKVQNNVSLYEGVECDDDVFLGPSMVFTNIKNPRSAVVRRGQYLTTRVGKGASIGANATIVCGTSLGEHCFVGAGAVVTRDVPAFALVVGNPARIVGWMSAHGHRLDLPVSGSGEATCPESGARYRLSDSRLSPL